MRKYYFKITARLPMRLFAYIGMFLAALLSVASWYWSYRQGLTIAYNDAMSHLNLSRLVVDNMQPGLSQLGSVWLPLSHMLSLPFIWNDWAWQSGFAGSIISMASYVVSVWAIYSLLIELTRDKAAGLVGAMVFALNVNILYLQTTPLTEPLYLALITLSLLYFAKFQITNDARYLLILGFVSALQILTRYDGWFVVAVLATVIFIHQLLALKTGLRRTIGKVFLLAFPSVFAAFLWLTWNLLIFGDPLYFALGPYSARAQQAVILEKAGLITKGDLLTSVRFYGVDIAANIGWYVLILSVIGLAAFMLSRYNHANWRFKLPFMAVLVSPIVFNVVALYLGFSVLNLPELGWNPNPDPSGQWFNVRYGIMALPFAAVTVGMIVHYRRYLAFLVAAIILLQSYLTFQDGAVTIKDGTVGSSAFANLDIAEELKSKVRPGEQVILSTSFFNAVAFRSGLHLRYIIHEGVSQVWDRALTSPEEYADWIVMANGSIGEPVYATLVDSQQGTFRANYKLFFKGRHADIYRRKSVAEVYIMKKDDGLLLRNKPYELKIVDDLDLSYKSQENILSALGSYNKAGFNTVRVLAAGDGCDQGFQPQSGIINETRLKNFDYLVAASYEYNLRLIPIMITEQSVCGSSPGQYLSWIGQDPSDTTSFFDHPVVGELFKNYLNTILSRENSITKNRYSEEPAILAWQLHNFSNKTRHLAWERDIFDYVLRKDSNHLIAIENDGKIDVNEIYPDKIVLLEPAAEEKLTGK